ncbi:RNA polymerase sigma factor [Parablautia muri]|uniref:RNA polymerase sigma factor n=1 Tax=Parablautia muri TaxID=2320879 RepID=A0A9X5GU78_9FIRM|nr:RNA polymerase sigma factor [Parablautia muri]NBJ93762.1 RNA polymerase sigma factor [Parablautia muri]
MTREDELLQRIGQGDTRAVDELIGIFYPEILRYCFWHAPNRSLAEDAAQETFLKVIRYFDRYTHKGKFKPFLYQVAANTCRDMWRKKGHEDVSLEELQIDFAYSEPGFESVQSDMALKQLVSSLPSDLQEIVLLRFGQDLTLREIAKATSMPLRTVQSRLRSALRKLKKDYI